MTEQTATVVTFHQDDVTYEIDDLGIGWPDQEGSYALYRGEEQLGEFLAEDSNPAVLIEQAQALLRELAR